MNSPSPLNIKSYFPISNSLHQYNVLIFQKTDSTSNNNNLRYSQSFSIPSSSFPTNSSPLFTPRATFQFQQAPSLLAACPVLTHDSDYSHP